jgi:LPXTG-motif cell wall-anchored protein
MIVNIDSDLVVVIGAGLVFIGGLLGWVKKRRDK